jgi:iron complex transport system ATP-binding protein
MPEPTLVASSVTYRVKSAELVSGVDFRASPGELLAVIGPNGAGKSTLLELLSGSLRPSEGQVLINGVDTVSALPGELASERSVLTQRVPIEMPYTAAQIVEMGRFPHRRDPANSSIRDAEMVAEAMRRTDTSLFANRIHATLSGGERSRVSLARVLAQDAPIVLLDEPTTALDVAHQETIMSEALHLARQGRTVVAVLHDLNAAAVYADVIVLMSQSRIAATGLPRDVLTAGLLTDVYDQPMVVIDHPFRDRPLVLADDKPRGRDPGL